MNTRIISQSSSLPEMSNAVDPQHSKQHEQPHEAATALLNGKESTTLKVPERKRSLQKESTVHPESLGGYFRQSERRMSKIVHFPVSVHRAFHQEEEDQLTLSVSCSLHLGVLEDARHLPCDHAFCLECLDNLVKSKSSPGINCPVCCQHCNVPLEGAKGWPPARLHNEIARILRNRQLQEYARSHCHEDTTPGPSDQGDCCASANAFSSSATGALHKSRRRGSILQKADVLKTLIQDLTDHGESMEGIERSIMLGDLKKLVSQLEVPMPIEENKTLAPSTSTANRKGLSLRRRSSIERCFQMQGEAEVMKRCCEYQMQKQRQPYLQQVSSSETASTDENMEKAKTISSICGHIAFKGKKAIHVFLDCHGMVAVYSPHKKTTLRFRPFLGHGIFFPNFLKASQQSILISGLVEVDGQPNSICLVRCDFEGRLLSRSQDYPLRRTEGDGGVDRSLSVMGFDLDPEGDRIFLANPNTFEILILNEDLEETCSTWCFEDCSAFRPAYVCYCKETNEIWSTNLSKNALLCLDIVTSNYRIFEGEKLFLSSPKYVVCTADGRVLFLDESQGRVFWVKTSSNFLCIQRLSFGMALSNFHPRLLQAMENGRILLADEHECFVGRPARDRSQHDLNCCVTT